jgi:hypothetical protein
MCIKLSMLIGRDFPPTSALKEPLLLPAPRLKGAGKPQEHEVRKLLKSASPMHPATE